MWRLVLDPMTDNTSIETFLFGRDEKNVYVDQKSENSSRNTQEKNFNSYFWFLILKFRISPVKD